MLKHNLQGMYHDSFIQCWPTLYINITHVLHIKIHITWKNLDYKPEKSSMKRLSAHGSNHHLNGSPGIVDCFFTFYPRSQFRCGTDDLNGDLSRHGTHFWLLVLMEFVNTIYLEACQRISSKLHYCFNLQTNDIFRISHLLSVKWIRNVRIYICFTINNFNQDTFFSSQKLHGYHYSDVRWAHVGPMNFAIWDTRLFPWKWTKWRCLCV